MPRANQTAGPRRAASPGEQPGNGVSQITWGGKNLLRLPGMLGPLPTPLPCSDTPQPCQGCAPVAKGMLVASEVAYWIWSAPLCDEAMGCTMKLRPDIWSLLISGLYSEQPTGPVKMNCQVQILGGDFCGA